MNDGNALFPQMLTKVLKDSRHISPCIKVFNESNMVSQDLFSSYFSKGFEKDSRLWRKEGPNTEVLEFLQISKPFIRSSIMLSSVKFNNSIWYDLTALTPLFLIFENPLKQRNVTHERKNRFFSPPPMNMQKIREIPTKFRNSKSVGENLFWLHVRTSDQLQKYIAWHSWHAHKRE